MRTFALAVVACFLAFLAVSTEATAGEVYKGTITSFDGGASSNRYLTDGGFDIGQPVKVTLQCTADMYICTDKDRAACTSTTGILVQANVAFPTSVDDSTNALTPSLPDGGFVVVGGGLISILPVTAATGPTCKVFRRSGKE